MLWNSLDEDDSEEIAKAKKKSHNDKNNEKYKQNGYFNEYFEYNKKCFICEQCGRKISSNTNKTKHMNTERCKEIYQERLEKEMMDKIGGQILLWNLYMNKQDKLAKLYYDVESGFGSAKSL